MSKELWKKIATREIKSPSKKLRFIKINAERQSDLDELQVIMDGGYDLITAEFESIGGTNLLALLREN